MVEPHSVKEDAYIETEEVEAEPDEYTYWDHLSEILLNPIVGWTLIAFVIAIALFWNKINQFLDRIYEKKQLKEYDAKCHKDPDWIMSHHEQMEASRRKMQEKYNAEAAEYKIKQLEKEKQKNLDKLLKSTMTEGGHRLAGDSSQRAEYSPLDGDVGGRYRPNKKTKCPGGGCG